jgi:hypothetical protein
MPFFRVTKINDARVIAVSEIEAASMMEIPDLDDSNLVSIEHMYPDTNEVLGGISSTEVDSESERPEPFASVMEIISEYGIEEVLAAISDDALFTSEDPEVCRCCREEALGFHEAIEALLEQQGGHHVGTA